MATVTVQQMLMTLDAKVRRLEKQGAEFEETIKGLQSKMELLEREKDSSPTAVVRDHPPTVAAAPPGTPAPRAVAGSATTAVRPGSSGTAGAAGEPATVAVPPLATFLDEGGKLKYNAARQFAVLHGKKRFAQLLKHPALVGSALFRGEVVDNPQGGGGMDSTVMFQGFSAKPNPDLDKVKMAVLERAIYPIHKRTESATTRGNVEVVTLGRTDDNDIVMQDQSISKQQFELRITTEALGRGFTYHLRDLGSTNRIQINNREVTPFDVVEIKAGDEIKLGRFFFTFTPPEVLFDKITTS